MHCFSFASKKGMEENRTAHPPLSSVSQSPSKAGGSLGVTLYKQEDNSRRCWVMSARCCFSLAVAEQELWMTGPLLPIRGWSQTTPARLWAAAAPVVQRQCWQTRCHHRVACAFYNCEYSFLTLGRILLQRHVPLNWMCWSSFPGNWAASGSVCSCQPAALKGICVSEVVWGDLVLNKILSALRLEQLSFKIIYKNKQTNKKPQHICGDQVPS